MLVTPKNNFYESKHFYTPNSKTQLVPIIYTNRGVIIEKVIVNKTDKKIKKGESFFLDEPAMIYKDSYGDENFRSWYENYSILKKGSLYIVFLNYLPEKDSFTLDVLNTNFYNLDDTDHELKNTPKKTKNIEN